MIGAGSKPDGDQVRIAVVIPFFQRTPGLLTTCLSSIAAQRLPPGVHVTVIVVDDASPFSAEHDIAATALPSFLPVLVVRQANAGPAAARNRGLDAVPDDTDFLAFIDSDDCWTPDHLAGALGALGNDGDFFFCDSEVEPGHTEFEQLPAYADPAASGLFAALPGRPDVFEFRRGDAPRQMTSQYVAHTSTVVYRWSPMADLRFEPALRYAGEDHLMWVRLAIRARAVRFTRGVNSVRGRGVSLYRDALDRVSASNIRRVACRSHAFELLSREPGLAAEAVAIARARSREQAMEVAGILLHPAGLRAALHTETRAALLRFLRPAWRRLPPLWGRLLFGRLLGVRLPVSDSVLIANNENR